MEPYSSHAADTSTAKEHRKQMDHTKAPPQPSSSFTQADAQATPPSQGKREPENTVLLTQQLPNVPGKQLTLIRVQYPPGAAIAPHRHPSFTIAYVLSGQIVSQVADRPVRTYNTGEFFAETPNEADNISRNASDSSPASLLAVLISDINAELIEPLAQ